MALKKTILPVVTVIILLAAGCEDKIVEKYKVNVPVYMSYEELRDAVEYQEPKPVEETGKIYFKDSLIFLNEPKEGIHVINNKNPESPQKVGYIKIPGNVDIAIKNNTLYVDSYVDLVSLDISDLNNIHEISRIKNEMAYVVPSYNQDYRTKEIDRQKGVVIDWKIETETKKITRYDPPSRPVPYPLLKGPAYYGAESGGRNSAGSDSEGPDYGTGGSMARFTATHNTLYALHKNSLKSFDLSNTHQPERIDSVSVGRNIETIFSKEQKLFIGSQSGVFIYDISEPGNPVKLSTYRHITSCDPVVFDGTYAYSTLRSGNRCGAATDRLDIIDVTDSQNPELVKSYNMNNPHGLGIHDNILFICDGSEGLKVYDASEPQHLTITSKFSDIDAYDVIPLKDVLILVAENGLYQYNYSDLQNIKQISTIKTEE